MKYLAILNKKTGNIHKVPATFDALKDIYGKDAALNILGQIYGEAKAPEEGIKPWLRQAYIEPKTLAQIPVHEALKWTIGKPITATLSPEETKTLPGQIARASELFAQGLINVGLLTAPERLASWAGLPRNKPTTLAETLASIGGEIAGLKVPISTTSKFFGKLPLTRRLYTPSKTLAGFAAKQVGKSALTGAGVAAITEPEEPLKERITRGAGYYSAFALSPLIKSKAGRIIASSLLAGFPTTLRGRPIEEQVSSYALGAIASLGSKPYSQMWADEKLMYRRAMKELAKVGKRAVIDLEKSVKDISIEIKSPKEHLKSVLEPFIPKKEPTWYVPKRVTTKKGEYRIILSPTEKIEKVKLSEKETKKVISSIKKLIGAIRKNPSFFMDTSDPAFVVNYIHNDPKILKDFNANELIAIQKLLQNYTPSRQWPFLKEMEELPLRKEALSELGIIQRWKKGLNIYDETLRPKLAVLKKLGFGDIEDAESLARVATEDYKNFIGILERYTPIYNYFYKVVGKNERAKLALTEYLEGRLSADKLAKEFGKEMVKVGDLMRKTYDAMLALRNKHHSLYKEPIVQRRKNYMTHLLDDAIRRRVQNQRFVPGWFEDLLRKGKISIAKHASPFEKPRKGEFELYIRDPLKALTSYVVDTAQLVSDNTVRKVDRIVRWLDVTMAKDPQSLIDYPNIKKHLEHFRDQFLRRPGELDIIIQRAFGHRSWNMFSRDMTSLLYASAMGGRLDLPIRNLFQSSLIIGRTGFKPLLFALRANNNTKVFGHKVKDILNSSAIYKTRLRAYLPGQEGEALQSASEYLTRKSLAFYRWSDIRNIRHALIAGYYRGRMMGLNHSRAIRFADKIAADTQFLYLPFNKSEFATAWGKAPRLGRFISMFTTWPSNYIEFLVGSADPRFRKEIIKYLGAALIGVALLRSAGIKGEDYFGLSSLAMLRDIATGNLPVSSILKRPSPYVAKQILDLLEGDKELKDVLFKTINK